MKYHPYKKDFGHSYAAGVYAVIELLKNRQDTVREIFLTERIKPELSRKICKLSGGALVNTDDKTVLRLTNQSGALVVAAFDKYESELDAEAPHIVLARPDDMGNIGTIMRSMVGFGYKDLVIIEPALDYFSPKVVRSSMGAIFSCNIAVFESLEDYKAEYPDHSVYAFTLGEGAVSLGECEFDTKYSLLFGNEGAGLSKDEVELGKPVFIEQTEGVDSLNLGVAASIGMYEARKKSGGEE